MIMYDAFIDLFIEDLQNISYSITRNPIIPGVRCMLQAVSPKITSVGTIKFVNYYLFLDWENDLFGRLDALIAAHKSFREVVNEDFHVPHGWRMTLPNIVVAAISSNPFSPEAITFVQSKYQIPWQGGEVGQMMLLICKLTSSIAIIKRLTNRLVQSRLALQWMNYLEYTKAFILTPGC